MSPTGTPGIRHDGTRQIRVASVPAGHVYVRHIAPPPDDAPDGVIRLPDPPPTSGSGGGWWPPAMLEADWVDRHADEFDLMHVHFGFDSRTPGQLTDLLDALERHGKPFVQTVHDLRNPHHPDPGQHEAQLDTMVPRAAAVLTLTPGAAEAIRGRWGVRAHVVPHPHVVELPLLDRPRPEHDGFVVGVHAKSLRAGLHPEPVIEQLADVVGDIPGGRLRVDLHAEVLTPHFPRPDPHLVATLRRLDDAGRIDLRVHDYFTDAQLWDYLQGLDVSVLPYRFGTHSGWLEACRDLGTRVVAPDCGFYAQQAAVHTYRLVDGVPDPTSLAAALHEAYAGRDAAWRASAEERLEQRRRVARLYRAVYEEVTA